MTPAETARRAFRQLYQYAPDEDCPVDQHRLAFLVRVEVLERVREAALQYLQAKTVEGARYALDVLKEAKP